MVPATYQQGIKLDGFGVCATADYANRQAIRRLGIPPDAASVGQHKLYDPTCRLPDLQRGVRLAQHAQSDPMPALPPRISTDLAITVSYDAKYAHQYDSLPVQEMSRIRWDFIRSYVPLPNGSRILDVGYGNGAFLRYARRAGMNIYGIDLHSEDFGIPVVDFDTPLIYDLVCFFDSLEHFPNFAPIFKLSARNVVISIPNTPDCLLTTPTDWRHFKPGEHLHYFSRQSLAKLMATWGFPRKIVDAFPEDILRGKLDLNGQMANNIYTAIYTRC